MYANMCLCCYMCFGHKCMHTCAYVFIGACRCGCMLKPACSLFTCLQGCDHVSVQACWWNHAHVRWGAVRCGAVTCGLWSSSCWKPSGPRAPEPVMSTSLTRRFTCLKVKLIPRPRKACCTHETCEGGHHVIEPQCSSAQVLPLAWHLARFLWETLPSPLCITTLLWPCSQE